jgi:hypothetical protein
MKSTFELFILKIYLVEREKEKKERKKNTKIE